MNDVNLGQECSRLPRRSPFFDGGHLDMQRSVQILAVLWLTASAALGVPALVRADQGKAPAAPASGTPDKGDVAQQAADMERPADWKGVLRNIKLAMERNLLRQPDFYGEDNLKRVLGGNRIEHPNLMGDVYDVCDLFKDAAANCIRVVKYGNRQLIAVESVNSPQLTAEAVQEVFGIPTGLRSVGTAPAGQGSVTSPLPAPTRLLKGKEARNRELQYSLGPRPGVLTGEFFSGRDARIVHFRIQRFGLLARVPPVHD